MTLKLGSAPGSYAQGDQAQMRGALERADARNLKQGVAIPAILLSSPDGGVWQVAVGDDGVPTIAQRQTSGYGAASPIGEVLFQSLEAYAIQAGITLGQGDDTAAFEAAEAAAAVAGSRLSIFIPPNPKLAARGNRKLYNNHTYYGVRNGSYIKYLPEADGSCVPFFVLSDPYNTGWGLSGVYLDGGFEYGRAPYAGAPETDPWLFQYIPTCNVTAAIGADTAGGQFVYTVDRDYTDILQAGYILYVSGVVTSDGSNDSSFNGLWPVVSVTSTTITVSTPGISAATYASGGTITPRGPFGTPDEGCQLGQAAIYLVNAFSGVDDANYYANSLIDSQNPRGIIEDVTVANFGGDGIYLQGAGGQRLANVQIFNCQGRGLVLNSYDNTLVDIDIGQIGLEPLYVAPNGSSTRIVGIKTWYGGGRCIAGHQMGWRLDLCGSVTIIGQVQDMSGDGIDVQGGSGNSLVATVGWQGAIASMASDIAALSLHGTAQGACVASQFLITATQDDHEGATPHPNVQLLVRTTDMTATYTGGGAATFAPTGNTIVLSQTGFPDDIGIDNPAWYSGHLDGNFVIPPGGGLRSPRQITPGDDGRAGLLTLMASGAIGRTMGGPSSVITSQIGAVIDTYQSTYQLAYYAAGLFNTVLAADSNLITASVPVQAPVFTVATLPDPAATPYAWVWVVDAEGGACMAFSDTANWRGLPPTALTFITGGP